MTTTRRAGRQETGMKKRRKDDKSEDRDGKEGDGHRTQEEEETEDAQEPVETVKTAPGGTPGKQTRQRSEERPAHGNEEWHPEGGEGGTRKEDRMEWTRTPQEEPDNRKTGGETRRKRQTVRRETRRRKRHQVKRYGTVKEE
ncbi:conglutin beta 3-like [Haliotis rubra]|uniref:conglutin beta 3-like n=1 Tax=Haliotis rubra TaxID=36100 RepID=UPI001EE622B7|nr:conglutin beta 3-like [Haliotis rubra]